MRRFAALYERLDRSTGTGDKRRALVDYFRQAPAADAAWAAWLLSGGKVGGARARIASGGELRAWAAAESGLPDWLVEDCYHQVGDLAETLALLFDDPAPAQLAPDAGLAQWIETRLAPLANADEAPRRALVVGAWRSLRFGERLVFNKLLTGALRVGVSQGLVQQALAAFSGVEIALLAQRMLGTWTPDAAFFEALVSPEPQPGDGQLPYPFFLASPLEASPESLGDARQWWLEWKWDGIRLQVLRRADGVVLWSRGEERMDGRFPEIEAAAAALPAGCVLDGELLAWRPGAAEPLPFSVLQTRIQRRRPGPKTLADAPVRVLAYDLLEEDGQDLRALPLAQRRARLAALLEGCDTDRLALSPRLAADDWTRASSLRDQARALGVEGLMLKAAQSPYRHGRKRGDWWKWKVDPLNVDAVLLYAQSGHGRRSTLFTDYTFGLWDGGALVPVAKAYSGLDDASILRLDRWIRAHTRERFGPVRSVEPVQVFELGFEGVNRSARHKSGVAVRFPRILRWREDKSAAEADAVDRLRALAR